MGKAPVWIDTKPKLVAWAEGARQATRLAVDTEANGFHAYRPRLCLVQLGYETAEGLEVALVDPLALEGELEELRELFEKPGLEKSLHGADYDIRLLHRDAGIALRGLYDTQVAAALVGRTRTGLAALAEEFAGVSLDKQAQKIDWARRPLPEKGLVYAAEDVEVVFAIRDALEKEVAELGRREWVDEENRLLESVRVAPEEEPEPGALLSRVSGAGRLGPQQRAVLGAALLWREREAARRDVPAVHLAPSKALLKAASRGARDEAGLVRAGLPKRLAERHGKALLRAFREGREGEPLPLPPPERPAPGTSPRDGELLKELRAFRNGAAKELGIDPGLACPTALLKELVRERPSDERGLIECGMKRWQADVFGQKILGLLQG